MVPFWKLQTITNLHNKRKGHSRTFMGYVMPPQSTPTLVHIVVQGVQTLSAKSYFEFLVGKIGQIFKV